jgi:hypothetical protein
MKNPRWLADLLPPFCWSCLWILPTLDLTDCFSRCFTNRQIEPSTNWSINSLILQVKVYTFVGKRWQICFVFFWNWILDSFLLFLLLLMMLCGQLFRFELFSVHEALTLFLMIHSTTRVRLNSRYCDFFIFYCVSRKQENTTVRNNSYFPFRRTCEINTHDLTIKV